MLAKIDVWFSRRKVQKAMAKISPRYLARSPVNIFSATKFITAPSLDDYDHLMWYTKNFHLRITAFRTATAGSSLFRLSLARRTRSAPSRAPEPLSSIRLAHLGHALH